MRYLAVLLVMAAVAVALPIAQEGDGQLAAAESLEARAQAMAQIRMFKMAAMKQAAAQRRARQKMIGESVHVVHAKHEPKSVLRKETSKETAAPAKVQPKAKALVPQKASTDAAPEKMSAALKTAAAAMMKETGAVHEELKAISKNGVQAKRDENTILHMSEKVQKELDEIQKKIPKILASSELGDSDETNTVDELKRLMKIANADMVEQKAASSHDEAYVKQASNILRVLSHGTRPAKLVEDISRDARGMKIVGKQDVARIIDIENAEKTRDKLRLAATHEHDVALSEVSARRQDMKNGDHLIDQAKQVIHRLNAASALKSTKSPSPNKVVRKSSKTTKKATVKEARDEVTNNKTCDASMSEAKQVACWKAMATATLKKANSDHNDLGEGSDLSDGESDSDEWDQEVNDIGEGIGKCAHLTKEEEKLQIACWKDMAKARLKAAGKLVAGENDEKPNSSEEASQKLVKEAESKAKALAEAEKGKLAAKASKASAEDGNAKTTETQEKIQHEKNLQKAREEGVKKGMGIDDTKSDKKNEKDSINDNKEEDAQKNAADAEHEKNLKSEYDRGVKKGMGISKPKDNNDTKASGKTKEMGESTKSISEILRSMAAESEQLVSSAQHALAHKIG